MTGTTTRSHGSYCETIRSIDRSVNAAGVEANMRLEYGTLDHLSRAQFREEIAIAKACESEQEGYLKAVAASYGMARQYDEDEQHVSSLWTPERPKLVLA